VIVCDRCAEFLAGKEHLMRGDIAKVESYDQPHGTMLPKLGYSIKEAQRITGIGRTTLWKAINKGKLRHFRVGRRILFSPEHLQDFLKAYER
jgi:excisionase family DNA binding protein